MCGVECVENDEEQVRSEESLKVMASGLIPMLEKMNEIPALCVRVYVCARAQMSTRHRPMAPSSGQFSFLFFLSSFCSCRLKILGE